MSDEQLKDLSDEDEEISVEDLAGVVGGVTVVVMNANGRLIERESGQHLGPAPQQRTYVANQRKKKK